MRNSHRLERPAVALLATATLLAGVGLPSTAFAADDATPSTSQSSQGEEHPVTDAVPDDVSWTLMDDVTLTADDEGTLTLPEGQTLPAFNAKPDGVTVQGSDGSVIPLSLADPVEEHPLLGVARGSGTLRAEATDELPAVSIPVTWDEGEEVTLSDGTPFTLNGDGVWEAAYGHALTLGDGNEPPVRNLGLSDGSKTEIQWGAPTLEDGKVVCAGVAGGEIRGQRWRATIAAERDTDHTPLTQAIKTASETLAQGGDEYTAASLAALSDAVGDAEALDATGATDRDMDAMIDRLTDLTDRLEAITWSVGDTTLSHEPGQGYEGKAPGAIDSAPADTVTLTSNDPDLPATTLHRIQDDERAMLSDEELGVIRATGTAHYTGTAPNGGRTAAWSQDYSYTLGKRVEATGPDGRDIVFAVADGILSATVTASLDQANRPKDATVTIDGRPVRVVWDDGVTTTVGDATSTFTRRGRAEGDVTVAGANETQHWVVYVTASRTEGHVASLSVIRRRSDGTTSEHAVDGFDPARTDYAVTLPADAVADQYTLGYTSAAGDQAEVSEGAPIPPALGEDAARILKATLNGVTYTVTVAFERSKPTPDNPDARLTGLYVNLTGKTEKGPLIEGWNPDVLDYTLRIGADDPGAYVLPEAPDGVSVKAGDVKRTGYATTQYWTVTAPDGQSRTYSVTVVRDHDRPTAEEAFAPGAATDVDGRTPADTRSDTGLVSHGYLLDGEYHAVAGSGYTIPEGGAFAYASKQGQTVRVSESRVGGMTWRYTLNILAPDGVTIAHPAPSFTVTYLTRATHEAAITGIIVDGSPIGGFDPSEHEYETLVDNLDHWTVTAEFDKTTGMGVTIHKDRDHATITAVSADGLVGTTYTLKVGERPLPGAGADGATVDALAETGAGADGPLFALAGLIALGLAAVFARSSMRRRHAGERGPDGPQAVG